MNTLVPRVPLYVLAGFGVLALLGLSVVLSPVLLDLFAPTPQVFQVLPVHLASNPSDAEHWDFSNPHPVLHSGDQLVGEFEVCYQDLFGGPYIRVEGRRSIVSLDGATRGALNPSSLMFSLGCHVTRSVIDNIPDALPPGTYYVEGKATAIATHYYHDQTWTSVQFDVAKR